MFREHTVTNVCFSSRRRVPQFQCFILNLSLKTDCHDVSHRCENVKSNLLNIHFHCLCAVPYNLKVRICFVNCSFALLTKKHFDIRRQTKRGRFCGFIRRELLVQQSQIQKQVASCLIHDKAKHWNFFTVLEVCQVFCIEGTFRLYRFI